MGEELKNAIKEARELIFGEFLRFKAKALPRFGWIWEVNNKGAKEAYGDRRFYTKNQG